MSSYIVFPVTGLVVTSLLVVVLIEKFICVPKRLSCLILHLTGNKMKFSIKTTTKRLVTTRPVTGKTIKLLTLHLRLRKKETIKAESFYYVKYGSSIFSTLLSFFFLNCRWSVSSYIVFPVTGLVVTSLLVVVLMEKFICVPKQLSHLILCLTGNKMNFSIKTTTKRLVTTRPVTGKMI